MSRVEPDKSKCRRAPPYFIAGAFRRFMASHAGGGGKMTSAPVGYLPGGTGAGTLCLTGLRVLR
jgi:hypothetical protein